MSYLLKFLAARSKLKTLLVRHPEKQNQHKLPQVYMRQFGYVRNGQFKVSVLERGEKHIRQKSIKSFLAEVNIFDIASDDARIVRSFEELNGAFENHYLRMVSDLNEDGQLSEKSFALLLQFIPNLLAQSDQMRAMVTGLLNSDVKTNFLKIICAHKAKSFEDLEKQDFYRFMVDSPVDAGIINRALLFFTDYLFQRTAHFDIVIIKSQEDKPWYTTDNPIIFENRTLKFEIMGQDSEVYFPLSPKYLLYLHFSDADDKENPLRHLKNNNIHIADDNENNELQRKIMGNAHKYVIMAGEN